MFTGKSGAASLSILVILGLIVLKVIAGILSGSLSILAQASDSLLDLFAVIISFLAVRMASKPADIQHPFGHGKIENFAAVFQAALIFAAAGSIVYSAVVRIEKKVVPDETGVGIGVMAVSIVASIFLSRHLRRVSRREDSPSLAANAHNIAADVYSAAAVFGGLILVRLTGWAFIDPVLAVIVALLIAKVAWDVLAASLGSLADARLPEEEEAAIREAIAEHCGSEVVGFHRLRTRKAGHMRYIDLHLVMPDRISLLESHDMCNHLEKDIRERLERTDVTIHVEPCSSGCEECALRQCSWKPDRNG